MNACYAFIVHDRPEKMPQPMRWGFRGDRNTGPWAQLQEPEDQVNFLSVVALCLYSSFHGLTRGDPGAGYSVHIWSSTSHTRPTLLFNTSKLESPIQLQYSKQSRSCATTTSSVDRHRHKQPISFLSDPINIINRLRSHRRREPAPFVLCGIPGNLPQKDPSLNSPFS